MENLQECVSCRCKKTAEHFTYGTLSCNKCIENKRAYNKKKSDEIHRLYPKTYCHICKQLYRDINWEKHLQFKYHKVCLENLKN